MDKSRVIVTCGLGYGDEGKGSMVDFLSRRSGASMVLRYTGGPQAAHYVTGPRGFSHCFSQFGSGTLIAGVRTHLCSTMLIKPQNLLVENRELCRKGVTDAFGRLSISPGCLVVTPYHAMMGQLREISRGTDRFGSVGMGVGEAVMDSERHGEKSLRMKDLFSPRLLSRKLNTVRELKCQEALELMEGCDNREMGDVFHRFQALSLKKELFDEYRNFVTALALTFSEDDQVMQQSLQAGEKIVFEGSQGALIDCDYGFWPFVTKTPTTVKAARELLARHGIVDEAFYLGIIRAYSYRHGPGPLVPEEPLLDTLFPESHNREGPWQGPVRRGWFDVLASRYALAINDHMDGLAVTHLDRVGAAGMVKLCTSYHYRGEPGEEVERYFISGGKDKRRITMLKPRHNGRSPDYSQKLLQCSPLDYLEFNGIPWDPRPGAGMHSPPLWLEHFIHFIESPDGLDVPVVVQSYGPGAEDKKVMENHLQGGIS